jgi:hypothetical protein
MLEQLARLLLCLTLHYLCHAQPADISVRQLYDAQ